MIEVHIGTSGYSYAEWKGKFYPEKIPPKEMLRFYSGQLGTVEINNTFYHMPTERLLTSWAEQVPDDFIFALKAPQVITHLKRLHNVFEETEYLFKTLSMLGNKLGPVLFQFPKSFRPDRSVLRDFLALIPDDRFCAFEFRNPSWRDDEVLDLLRNGGHSLCVADTDERPDAEIIDTASWGYLRLRRSAYGDDDLSRWAGRLLPRKWNRAFVYFKHEDGAAGPLLAKRFHEIIESMRKKV